MNKKELISATAEKAGLTKKDTKAAVDSVFEVIAGALTKGEKVTIIGFGSFEVVQRKARTGVNPQTKQKLHIPAKTAPRFKASKVLKAKVG